MNERATEPSFGIDYSRLPEHMRDGARLYMERGIEPGHFLSAVLCNDLMEAFKRADHINAEAMQDWVEWIYNEAPTGSHGSMHQFEEWMRIGGMRGLRKAAIAKAEASR